VIWIRGEMGLREYQRIYKYGLTISDMDSYK